MRDLAEKLNDAGFEVQDGIVIKLPIQFTEFYIKDAIVNPVALAMYDKTTSQLSTVEIKEVYRQVDRVISERTGVSVAWPSDESLSMEFQQ
ncbi:MAG: hypothetical protein GY750_17020 [Lentisphaerae bacterium]|nr:hypothetical protein [Lentisphaerota bacterium]